MAIALIILLAAATTAAVVLALLVRRRRSAERRRAGLAELARRLDVLAEGLGDTVDRAHAETLRARKVESLDRYVELDEALARCAEAAASLPSVELAVARVDIDGVPVIATAGVEGAPAKSRTAVAVPLEVEGRRLGSLTVYGRSGAPPVPGDELDALQTISRRSAPMLRSAPRLTVVAPVDSVAGALGDREQFHEALALLAARARRQGSALSVCVLDLDDFRVVNRRIGSAAADRVIAEVAEAIRETLRPVDLACRTGGDEFAVAMPGAARIEAESLVARVQATLAQRPKPREAKVGLTVGIAELEKDDDGVSLFERASATLRRAKAAKGTAA
jgi:diguanylate cyclase (GGDEF)-like protein